jgi:hypothetical protein
MPEYIAYLVRIDSNGDSEIIDETSLDEKSEGLARALFAEFGHDMNDSTLRIEIE